jgi:proton-translocating NADH-quinone oxidoreductase chain L
MLIFNNLFLNFMILGCLFWPLYSAIICGFFGYLLGSHYSKIFAVSCLFLTFLSSCYLFFILGFNNQVLSLKLFTCFDLYFNAFEKYQVTWGLYFDAVTAVMLVVISSISFVVHLYAASYMNIDPHQPRFFANLSLFTFFMMVLVTADNYFQLFVGWEGVGLCSYLLIGFWYNRLQANKSALQALVVNKVGDFALIIAIVTLFLIQGETTLQTTFTLAPLFQSFEIVIGFWSISLGNFIGFLFFIGAVAKSAQIGLHTWLLSAMEGPTPVSALLHAATMVTAGIFLMIRSSIFWQQTPDILFLMTIIGATTAFFAATCGLVQHDIKKIIAFSTCSQLGYMFYSCGLGEYTSSLYHLTNHAFFKALLFLGAGAVIHALQGEQDLRRMGGLAQLMPVTYTAMLIASLSLLGFPFLSGFYSKDILIELAWVHYTIPSTFAFWLATLSAMLTAFYSTRLLYFVFLADTNTHKVVSIKVHETDQIMLSAFRPLIVGSIFSGYFFHEAFVGMGTNFFMQNNEFIMPLNSLLYLLNTNLEYNYLECEFLPSFIKLIPVFFSFFGIFIAIILYTNSYNLLFILSKMQMTNSFVRQLHFFTIKKWYFDIIYNNYIAAKVYKVGYTFYESGDQGVIEWFGPQGFYTILTKINFFQQSKATLHLEWLLQGVCCLVIFIWFLI